MRFELDKLELFGLDLGSLWQRWWRGINSLTPIPVTDIFLSPAPKIRVLMEAEHLVVEQVLPSQDVREVIRLGYPEFGVLEDNSLHEQLTAGMNKKLLQLDLVVPEQQVLRRNLSMPVAARSNLRQALGFQVSKLTPFSREQVFYAVVERAAHTSTGMLEVELQVVPKAFVNTWLEQVARVTGLPVARLLVPSLGRQLAPANLLGELGVPSRWARRLNHNGLLLIFLALSLGLAMAAPVIKLRTLVVQGKQEITQLSREVEGIRQEWYDLQQGAANLTFLLEQYAQHGKPTLILDELTRLIPDNVYLTAMKLEKNRLEISGQGTDVVDLVEILNESGLFEGAKFASAVTRGRDNRDVFVISMQLATQEEQP